jgi:phosphate:Na+ symporter
VLINIIGGVCLLLWGLRGVRNGISRAFGAGLHMFIANSTSNRIKALFAGMGVTALLQSSTATALIVAAFCSSSLISTSSGIAVMLGADIGTTLVAQLLSFDLSWLAPFLITVGFVIFSVYQRAGKLGHIGKLILGLGLMLFALGWIKMSAEPVADSEILVLILQSLKGDPIFAILIAAILTWMAHSSLAIVLLLVSLSSSGVLPVDVALYFVLGANLGGVMAPLLATMKGHSSGCRVPLGNLLIRFAGVLMAFSFVPEAHALLESFDPDPARLLVNYHTAFNIALALVFLPLTSVIGKICTIILPDKSDPDDPSQPKYLDDKESDSPTIALTSLSRETLRMADILEEMLEDTITAFKTGDISLVSQIREKDDVLDKLYKAIKLYMARLSQESLDPDEGQLYIQVFSFATNIEHAGDIIDKGLMPMAEKKIRDRRSFSEEGMKEIENIHYLVLESVRLAQTIFVSEDIRLARQMIEGKERLRQAEHDATAAHIERLRESVPETISTSSLHVDIIRDYRRINTHMCTVAYPLLEEVGAIRSTRLKPLKKEKPV